MLQKIEYFKTASHANWFSDDRQLHQVVPQIVTGPPVRLIVFDGNITAASDNGASGVKKKHSRLNTGVLKAGRGVVPPLEILEMNGFHLAPDGILWQGQVLGIVLGQGQGRVHRHGGKSSQPPEKVFAVAAASEIAILKVPFSAASRIHIEYHSDL